MGETEPLPASTEPTAQTEPLPDSSVSETEAFSGTVTESAAEVVAETEPAAESVTEIAETPITPADGGTAARIRDFVPAKPVPVVPVSVTEVCGIPSGGDEKQPELPAAPVEPEKEASPAQPAEPRIEEPAVTEKPVLPEQEPALPAAEPAMPAEPAVPETPVTPQEPAAPTETEEIRVSFLGAGDSIVHEGIFKEAAKWAKLNGNGREYDFSHLFTDVKYQIAGADIAFINQETPMAGESCGYSGYPLFNTPRDLAWDLVGTGFDVVNLANNHMLDQGAEGLRSNISFWQAMSCTEIGGYRNQADYDDIRVVERNGVKVAFLSYCTMTNGFTLDPSSSIVIPYLDENVIRRQTAAARELADFVVVSVHWGEDNVQYVTNDQKNWAKLFADCGVDVILGHHPHLIQPIEWLTGVYGNRCLCAYSLGNLYSLMAESKNMVGGFLKFDFVKTGDETSIQNVRFVPTVFFYKTTFFGQHIYFMKDYTEALAAAHGTQTYDTALLTAAQLADYVAEVIDARFLPVNWGPQG